MVSPLRFFKTDPNKLGRGQGIYYLRGKGYYSKYDVKRDIKIKAKGYKEHKSGYAVDRKTGKRKGSSIQHTSDGRLSR